MQHMERAPADPAASARFAIDHAVGLIEREDSAAGWRVQRLLSRFPISAGHAAVIATFVYTEGRS